MSQLSIPPSGYNGLQKTGFWAVKRVVATQFPVSALVVIPVLDKFLAFFGKNKIDKIKERFEQKSLELWNQKIAYEDAPLNENQEEQLYFIAHRFFQTVSQGTVDRNLHLLAKLIRKQIDDEELSYEKYVTLDNAIRDLSFEEMIVLSEICQQIGSKGRGEVHNFEDTPEIITITIENYHNISFKKLVEIILEKHVSIFSDKLAISSTFSLLPGKGWVLPISNATINGGTMKYRPSIMVNTVKDKIAEIDLTQGQGNS